jgi:hypothetical protein
MYGIGDDIHYMSVKLEGAEKSIEILKEALKTLGEIINGDPLMKSIANEALVKHYENEKATEIEAEK